MGLLLRCQCKHPSIDCSRILTHSLLISCYSWQEHVLHMSQFGWANVALVASSCLRLGSKQGEDSKIGTGASPSRSVFLLLLGGLKPSLCRTFIFSWRMVSKAISMDSRLLSWALYVCAAQRMFRPPTHPNQWTIEVETSHFHLVMAVEPLSALHAALIVCQDR